MGAASRGSRRSRTERRRSGAALAGRLWALPCTLLGLALGLPLLLAGGSLRRVDGVLELALHRGEVPPGRRAAWLPFAAITFGHVVLGVSHAALARLRAHERVHVRQYERWGPLFLVAYPLASVLMLLRGRRPYADNPFEVQARRAGEPGGAGP
jgi:hypothetical protein